MFKFNVDNFFVLSKLAKAMDYKPIQLRFCVKRFWFILASFDSPRDLTPNQIFFWFGTLFVWPFNFRQIQFDRAVHFASFQTRLCHFPDWKSEKSIPEIFCIIHCKQIKLHRAKLGSNFNKIGACYVNIVSEPSMIGER